MSYFNDRFINPLSNFGFKKLFASEPNKDLLIDFLNQVLPKEHQIQSLDYGLASYQLNRRAVFSLKCISESGDRFIVALQKEEHNVFKSQNEFYASFPIKAQIQNANVNDKCIPLYAIDILDFVFRESKNDDELLHRLSKNGHNGKNVKLIYIELAKFTKMEHELDTHFDQWLFVLKNLSNLEDRHQNLQGRVFITLFEAAEIAKFTPKEQAIYADNVKNYRDLNKVVDTSRQEGRMEEKKEIAKKILAMGMSLQEIADITGLSTEEAKTL